MRLPFGLAVSSEIFQKRLQVALEGLPGVACIADDILVYGVGDTKVEADDDHDRIVEQLMNRCQTHGIRLNPEKTEVKVTSLSFQGHVITDKGILPDPHKIEAIRDMEAPQNVTEVQRLAGMVNYLAKFLPQLSDVMQPIRRLTNVDVEWHWGKVQQDTV